MVKGNCPLSPFLNIGGKTMAVTAQMVKELREKTGAGMMDCKKALTENDGNMEKAVDWLREKGMAQAAKKADRIAAEGLTAIEIDGNSAVIAEVNAETDFVAKNENFKSLLNDITKFLLAKKPSNVEAALAENMNDNQTLKAYLNDAIAKIGEKISLRRFSILEKSDNEVFGAYLHMGGRIAVLNVIEGADEETAKDIAMHVAAVNPKYIDRNDVPEEEVEREKEVLKQQALNEGKPANIVEKMVTGRLNKYFEEICLLDQEFVKDSDQKVGKYLKSKGGTISSFVRYEVGEGMERREENFAEEVMSQMKN